MSDVTRPTPEDVRAQYEKLKPEQLKDLKAKTGMANTYLENILKQPTERLVQWMTLAKAMTPAGGS